jgi:hypothetical protein
LALAMSFQNRVDIPAAAETREFTKAILKKARGLKMDKTQLIVWPMVRDVGVSQEFLPEPRCVVRESAVHGLGVFASTDVETGGFLTLYPADGYVTWDSREAPTGLAQGVSDQAYELSIRDGIYGPCLSIVGDPLKLNATQYLGHMVNDGAKLSDADPRMEEVYLRKTAASENCIFNRQLGCMVATRDIKKGDELFMMYGPDYWLAQLRAA